jgi:hypothetical protein
VGGSLGWGADGEAHLAAAGLALFWRRLRVEQLIWDGFLKKKLLWDGNDLFSVLFPMKSVVFKINSLTLSKAKGENFDVLLQVIRAG